MTAAPRRHTTLPERLSDLQNNTPMKLTLLLPAKPDHRWTLAKQVGVNHAVTKAAPDLSGLPAPYDLAALTAVRDRFTQADIKLLGLEGDQFDMSRIKWGLPGRDADIERYQQMLRNMAALNLRLLCYNFMPRPRGAHHDWHRTDVEVPLRGGSLTTRFDLAAMPQPAKLDLTADQLWDNYAYFIHAVMPVAQDVGVTMAAHPDDPPLKELGGIGRIFNTPEAFDRAYDLAPSPSNAVTFCQANFRLMGADLEATVRKLAQQKRLAFVHLRDVQGDAHNFTEVWHDEGPTDMPAMLKLYHDVGFDGPIRDDHVPTMHSEDNSLPGYAMLGHLFAVGYIKGILQTHNIPYQ